jgi:hypothetical protein
VAVAATILAAAYYILRDGVSYRERGRDHFLERDRTRAAQCLARRSEPDHHPAIRTSLPDVGILEALAEVECQRRA